MRVPCADQQQCIRERQVVIWDTILYYEETKK